MKMLKAEFANISKKDLEKDFLSHLEALKSVSEKMNGLANKTYQQNKFNSIVNLFEFFDITKLIKAILNDYTIVDEDNCEYSTYLPISKKTDESCIYDTDFVENEIIPFFNKFKDSFLDYYVAKGFLERYQMMKKEKDKFDNLSKTDIFQNFENFENFICRYYTDSEYRNRVDSRTINSEICSSSTYSNNVAYSSIDCMYFTDYKFLIEELLESEKISKEHIDCFFNHFNLNDFKNIEKSYIYNKYGDLVYEILIKSEIFQNIFLDLIYDIKNIVLERYFYTIGNDDNFDENI